MKARSCRGLPPAPLALGLALAVDGCDDAGYEPVQGVPEARPSDGRLSSPALQEVLELQILRDGSALGARLAAPETAVLDALGKLRSVEAAEVLLWLDVLPGEEVRRVLALSRLGAVDGIVTPAGLARLVEGLGAPDPGVRTATAYYFGRPDPCGGPHPAGFD